MSIFYILWEAPYLLVWFLVFFILVQLIWRPIRFIAGVLGKALLSWVEKLMEAFIQAILPAPEKTGEQLGAWVLSCFGLKRK